MGGGDDGSGVNRGGGDGGGVDRGVDGDGDEKHPSEDPADVLFVDVGGIAGSTNSRPRTPRAPRSACAPRGVGIGGREVVEGSDATEE